MTVLSSDRSTPLSKNSGNTLAAAINLAWDFTGVDSAHMDGVPWVFGGATSPTLVKTGSITLVTLNGEPSRVFGSNSSYEFTSTTDYGLQTGTGDFLVGIRFNTASVLPSSGRSLEYRISGATGPALSVYIQEDTSAGWYMTANGSTSCPIGSSNLAEYYLPNTTFMVWVQMISGVVTTYTQNVTAGTAPVVRHTPGSAATTPMNAGWAARTLLISSVALSGGITAITHWNAGLSLANITALGADFWSTETNTAVSSSITINSPVAGSAINGSSAMSGTYTGTAPSGVDIQFGANAFVTGTGMTIGGGNWSGTFALAAGGPSTLQARESNAPSVMSATVANITVNSNTIAFTAMSIGTGVADLVPASYRIYQRNGSNQATVRIKGTYTGTPTSIEYTFNGGAYATLVASPSGGVFNQTVVLTGLAQGNLTVRFSNATGIAATLTAIGVGQGFLVAGQSNHVGGGAGGYVPFSAPSAHPAWVASIFDKTGTWRPNVETSTDPFSKTTNATGYPTASAEYAVEASSSSAYGSYFGALATLIMAQGVPVTFVPCALGSTSIANWAVSTSNSTLYGAMLARATETGISDVIWWQGEADCTNATTRTAYEAALNALINDWCVTRFPGARWTLMNLNSAGNAVGTGGTGGSDTGFNAIHAAIANVAATNSHVAAIGDMNTTTFSQIHYASASEINAVANIAYNSLNSAYNYAITYATTVSFPVTDVSTGQPATGLVNLDYAVFDQSRYSALNAPIKKGSTLAVSGGNASVDITGLTTLVPGGTALVLAGPSNGLKAMVGQVVVS